MILQTSKYPVTCQKTDPKVEAAGMVRNDCSADTRLLEKTDFLEKVVTDDEM
jgi:hypothetical protein